MSGMTMETLSKGVILFPKGYVDKNYGGEIQSHVEQLIGQGRKIIVLSFRDCPIINSTGLAKLIEIIELTAANGAELWFADLSNLHHQTFDAAGMIALIQKVTNSPEAKTLLGGA